MRKNFNIIACFILFIFILSFSAISYAGYLSNSQLADKNLPFSDVPANSYAYEAINRLRQLGITGGIGGNRFGYGQALSRGEFITLLVKTMEWTPVTPKKGSYIDNRDPGKFYYSFIETALAHGAISKDYESIRPNAPVTREEAVIMIVNSLGYGNLAKRLYYLDRPYTDVKDNTGYINIAKDFGIISDSQTFNPAGQVLREQAAVMLVRLYEIAKRRLKELNGFYAIKSSSQQDKIPDLTSVCFGWSRLSFDESKSSIVLNLSQNEFGYNEYFLPSGFSDRLALAKKAGIPALLMVYSSQDSKMTVPSTGQKTGIPEYVLTHKEVYRKVIGDIISSVNEISRGSEKGSFDGVVIDFEGLRGEKLKNCFNEFIKELKAALDKHGKKLYVSVHPLMHPKRSASSIDGYDYRTIGLYADRVILMAHDYDAKKLTQVDMKRGFAITPLSPIEDVYYALKAITDSRTGVQDKEKIMLQISFNWTVWQKKDGKTVNEYPLRFDQDNFMEIIEEQEGIQYYYNEDYANPYIKYIDPKTGYENVVWYENTRSVMEKTRLARYFGIRGISLWRLGLVPDHESENAVKYGMDVWQNLLKEME